MSRFLVNMCVCHKVSFEEIKAYVDEYQVTEIKQLQAKGLCSTKCQMCVPYIELVLKTGETEFEPGAYIRRKKIS